MLLAIDTSTLTASVALARIGEAGDPVQIVASADSDTSTHSDVLVPLIDRLLSEAGVAMAEVGALAVGAGPGSFTGLRIGMATAKGLAYAIDAPLWAVSSLAALAQDGADHLQAPPGSCIVAALDARRDEIFAGLYQVGDAGLVKAIGDERVLAPADLGALELPDSYTLCGDGALRYAADLGSFGSIAKHARVTPSARSVARLAAAGSRENALELGAPAYIRKSEAEIRFPRGNPGGTFAKRK